MKKILLIALIAFFGVAGGAYASGDEIKVDILDDYSIVEWEIGNDEGEFELNETNEEEIIDMVADELDLSGADVEDIIEFEHEDDDDSNDNNDNDQIEVEVKDDHAQVEWEVDGDEGSLDVDSTDEDVIIEVIAEELDMSIEDVETITEFNDDDSDDSDKSHICHKGKTLEVGSASIFAHLNHGDVIGECNDNDSDEVHNYDTLSDGAREKLIKELTVLIEEIIQKLFETLLAQS